MRIPIVVGCATVAVVLIGSACGGGGNPGAPSSQPPGGTSGSVISIVGQRGAQSFSPNPGSGGQDQMIAWRNNDSVTHRIVVNDTNLDTGDIPPGGTSRSLQLAPAGANYHCSLHPAMIGSVTASGGAPPPPCTGVYC